MKQRSQEMVPMVTFGSLFYSNLLLFAIWKSYTIIKVNNICSRPYSEIQPTLLTQDVILYPQYQRTQTTKRDSHIDSKDGKNNRKTKLHFSSEINMFIKCNLLLIKCHRVQCEQMRTLRTSTPKTEAVLLI